MKEISRWIPRNKYSKLYRDGSLCSLFNYLKKEVPMLKFIKEDKVVMISEDNGELKITDEDLKESFEIDKEDITGESEEDEQETGNK